MNCSEAAAHESCLVRKAQSTVTTFARVMWWYIRAVLYWSTSTSRATLKGTGEMTVAGETQPVGTGNFIYMPSSQPHSLKNTGEEDLHTMFVMCRR